MTGLRWGELIALRPCDIVHHLLRADALDHPEYLARRRRGRAPGQGHQTNRDRLVPLASVALQIADQWARGKDRDALLVTGRDGGPLDG